MLTNNLIPLQLYQLTPSDYLPETLPTSIIFGPTERIICFNGTIVDDIAAEFVEDFLLTITSTYGILETTVIILDDDGKEPVV